MLCSAAEQIFIKLVAGRGGAGRGGAGRGGAGRGYRNPRDIETLNPKPYINPKP